METRDLETQAGMAYVWGYQDAGGAVVDSSDAGFFGEAWGKLCQLYRDGKIPGRKPMRDAYAEWRACGEITQGPAVIAKQTRGGTTYVTITGVTV